MVRTFLNLVAAGVLALGGSLWAADSATPAASPTAAAATAAPTVEDRLAALEKQLMPTTVIKKDGDKEIVFSNGSDGLTVGEKAERAWQSLGQYEMNPGDNAWMLVAAALVLLMTLPGLALFYGGLVRSKNVLGTMMQCISIAGIISALWLICGYSLAFSGDGKFIGNFDWLFLNGVLWDAGKSTIMMAPNATYAMSIPHGTFMLFQMMFAIITPALICGAYAERIKFSGMVVFSVLWFFVVYIPMAHMVWGNGGMLNWWADQNGEDGYGMASFDFAGGTVVHISSGVAALVLAIVLGRRKVADTEPMRPHNLTLSFIGACLLWVGWFGFNAGSALCASGLATLAFANTQIAAAAAAIAWPIAEWIIRGKPTVLGAISGAVAGLVAITPAAGFVSPTSALIIGLVAGVLCFVGCSYLKAALKYDDALDAFGVHGIGGIWGAMATGIFFQVDANPGVQFLNAGLADAIRKGTHSYGTIIFNQLEAVAITVVFSAVATLIIALVVKYTVGLRVTADDEAEGLDVSQHGEEGYHKLT